MSLRTITEFAPWPPARRALKRLIYWPGAPNHRKLRWNRARQQRRLFAPHLHPAVLNPT